MDVRAPANRLAEVWRIASFGPGMVVKGLFFWWRGASLPKGVDRRWRCKLLRGNRDAHVCARRSCPVWVFVGNPRACPQPPVGRIGHLI